MEGNKNFYIIDMVLVLNVSPSSVSWLTKSYQSRHLSLSLHTPYAFLFSVSVVCLVPSGYPFNVLALRFLCCSYLVLYTCTMNLLLKE